MGVFSGKKGNFQEIVLGPLFPILIAFFIFLLMLNYTSSVAKSSYFEREFLSRDIGLLIESLQASPGDVKLNYPQENMKSEIVLNIKKGYVEAYAYDVDPKLAPSKTTRFYIPQSKLDILELKVAPKVEKSPDGKTDYIYPYSLFFQKTASGIAPSSTQVNIAQESQRSCSLINTFVENWNAPKKVYVGTLYSRNEKKTVDSSASSREFAKAVCTSLQARSFSAINNCEPFTSSNAADSDIIILVYVNEEMTMKKTINVYYLEGDDNIASKSQKLSCELFKLTPAGVKYSGDISNERMIALTQDISSLTSQKPAIIVEINNIETLQKDDIQGIGTLLFNAVKDYYTGR